MGNAERRPRALPEAWLHWFAHHPHPRGGLLPTGEPRVGRPLPVARPRPGVRRVAAGDWIADQHCTEPHRLVPGDTPGLLVYHCAERGYYQFGATNQSHEPTAWHEFDKPLPAPTCCVGAIRGRLVNGLIPVEVDS